MVVLHRLFEPPVSQFLQRPANADRATYRIAIIRVECEREPFTHHPSYRSSLRDVAGEVSIEICSLVIKPDLNRGGLVFQSFLDDPDDFVWRTFAVPTNRGVERQSCLPGTANQF